MNNPWIKPAFVIVVMGLLAWHLPAQPIDPWNLLNLKKIALMVFALAFVQTLGSVAARVLGVRAGAVLTGFFGGLVSSTATTATLARRSRIAHSSSGASEALIFLSSTAAMLVEAAVLVWTGSQDPHLSVLALFLLPLVATLILLGIQARRLDGENLPHQDLPFHIWPIVKLAIFIVTILLASKILQNLFGQNGLLILTFLVSLFEIHSSIIANVQLHEAGSVDAAFLVHLLTASVLASYISKIGLISLLGTSDLRAKAIRAIAIPVATLLACWLVTGFVL